MVKIYAPASIGNVSVGFDVLGAAVSPVDGSLLGDCVSVEAADQFSLQNKGRFVSKLPADPQENIVYQCWQRFCQAIGKDVPVAMTLEKNMPIGSGLGSSACSVVAGLMAMNEFCGQPLNDTELLALLKSHFRSVKHAKPPASRKGSSEWYVIAQGFKGEAR